MTTEVPFDFAAWRTRTGLTKPQICNLLDISLSFYQKVEKAGRARSLYIWAAHGIECQMKAGK